MNELRLVDRLDLPGRDAIDLAESNRQSRTIKGVEKAMSQSWHERFYETLLDQTSHANDLTNSILDFGSSLEVDSPLLLFSSPVKCDSAEERRARREYSAVCRYTISPEIRSAQNALTVFGQVTNVLRNVNQSGGFGGLNSDASRILNENRKGLTFHLRELYGLSLDEQVTQGFIDRERVASLSAISIDQYELVADELLQAKACNGLLHYLWCSQHCASPFATFAVGSNELGPSNCPICKSPLSRARNLVLSPEIEAQMRHFGGLIPVLIGFAFAKRGVRWTADATIERSEYGDLLLERPDGYSLIECKVFSRDRNDRGFRTSLQRAATQAIEHAQFWKSRGIPIRRVHVATNVLEAERLKETCDELVNRDESVPSDIRPTVHPFRALQDLVERILE